MAIYTKAQMRTRVREILNEPTARVFTDTELNKWIDTGARLASILTLCKENSEDVNTATENKMEYALTKEYIMVESAVFNDEDDTDDEIGLQRIDPRMIGHVHDGTAGKPIYYFHFENSLFVWPAASTGIVNGSITVFGYTVVDDYGTSGGNLPEEIERLVLDFALSCAYTKIGKHQKAGLYMQRFMNNCSIHRRDVNEAINILDTHDMFRIPDRTVVAE